MKIIIASSGLKNKSKTRGIGVYTRELIQALSNRVKTQDLQILTTDTNPYRLVGDLVHYPFFDLFFHTLPLLQRIKTVVTIHDVIPLKYPQHFKTGIRGKLNLLLQKLAIKKVCAIITDSISSKRDIIKYLKIPAENIYVIPLAASSNRSSFRLSNRIKNLYKLPSSYILYVGDINWNKNLSGLINAIHRLKNDQLHLVCIGKVFADKPDIPEYNLLVGLITKLQLQDRVHLIGYVPAHHLPLVYHLALAYIQPSWDEGFGLTILEAMSYGCPVISSNRGSLTEVAGDAAMYFDPADMNALPKSIETVSTDSRLRDDLSSRGILRARQFSWAKTAAQTILVYRKVCDKI